MPRAVMLRGDGTLARLSHGVVRLSFGMQRLIIAIPGEKQLVHGIEDDSPGISTHAWGMAARSAHCSRRSSVQRATSRHQRGL
jgi:hypothetical protein